MILKAIKRLILGSNRCVLQEKNIVINLNL